MSANVKTFRHIFRNLKWGQEPTQNESSSQKAIHRRNEWRPWSGLFSLSFKFFASVSPKVRFFCIFLSRIHSFWYPTFWFDLSTLSGGGIYSLHSSAALCNSVTYMVQNFPGSALPNLNFYAKVATTDWFQSIYLTAISGKAVCIGITSYNTVYK